jgi:HlyD family secretion protein
VYEATMRQAEGDLASAQAEVLLKRQNLQRKKVLTPMHAASQLDLDQATAELAEAEATVLIKQAVVDSARANVGYCKITSPVDGMVISRKVDVGQTVIAAMSTPLLFTIAQDITKMHISTSVSEADVGHVEVGQTVNFTVDAFPDEIFHGQVSQVREAPTTVQNVVTYETLIDVDNSERKLFPGMTADVSILVAERKNVIEVPNAALRFTPPDGAAFASPPPKKLARDEHLVYALAPKSRKLTPVVVKIGISDNTDTEIREGVAEHIAVVVSSVEPPQQSGFGG